MINLYDKFETDFTHNGEVVLSDCKSCYITQELNGAYYLELEYPRDERGKYKYIDGWNIIKADGQLFRIPVIDKNQDSYITIKARANHIFYDLLNDFNEDTRAENKTVQQALTIAIAINPKYSVGLCDDLGTNTAYFISENPVKGIYDKILKRWGGELLRDNFTISVKNRLGADRGVLVSYGKNILGFTQTLDWTNVATKIKPVGKNGITIDIVNQGSKYLISPRVNDYPFVITKEVKFEDIEDASELKAAALALWGTIDLPTANYKVNFLDLSKIKEYELIKSLITLELGDTVTIRHKIFNVDLSARVIKVRKNVLTGKIEDLEIGQFKSNLADKFSKVDSQIQYTQESVEETKEDLSQTKTLVQQNSEQISLQAESIDGLVGRVSTAEQKITADAIVSTVRTSQAYNNDLGGLDSRLDNAESTITQHSNQIATKVDVNGVKSTIEQNPDSVKIGFNNISNVVDIDSGGITVNHIDGSYTKMEGSGFKRYTGSTGKEYHYLTYTDYVYGSESFYGSAGILYPLPSEFCNKDITISTYAEAAGDGYNYILGIQSTGQVESKENGTIRIWGEVRTSAGKIPLRIRFVVIA